VATIKPNRPVATSLTILTKVGSDPPCSGSESDPNVIVGTANFDRAIDGPGVTVTRFHPTNHTVAQERSIRPPNWTCIGKRCLARVVPNGLRRVSSIAKTFASEPRFGPETFFG